MYLYSLILLLVCGLKSMLTFINKLFTSNFLFWVLEDPAGSTSSGLESATSESMTALEAWPCSSLILSTEISELSSLFDKNSENLLFAVKINRLLFASIFWKTQIWLRQLISWPTDRRHLWSQTTISIVMFCFHQIKIKSSFNYL